VALTTPTEARAAIAGRIYEGQVAPDQLLDLAATRRVTQAILVEGQNRVRLYETAGAPPAGFEPVPATLEDAYLLMIREGAGNGNNTSPQVTAA
jgi:hypothetical protein